MNFSNAHSPKWANEAHTAIELYVTFERIGEVPFCASPDDVEAHGREIFSRAVAGDFGQIATYAAPVAPAVVPAVVSRAQGREALFRSGYLPAVEAYMATAPWSEQNAWESVTEFRRDSPLLKKLALLLNLSSAQLDDLFVLAASCVF